MTVRLKNRVSPRKPVGRIGYNGTNNGNGTSEAQVADTAAPKKTRTRKKVETIEEPVILKVTRTTKKKASPSDPQIINASTDQENSDQPKDEDTEIDLNTIEVRRFLVEPAKVNFHYTLGRNVLFQSVTVGCSVTIPCYKEEIEDAMEEAKQMVADRLKIENRKTGAVLDFLVDQRIKKDQELTERGIR